MDKITIHDLANELKVSTSTISRALTNHPRISKKTKDLILNHAKIRGYSQNAIASALRSGRSNMIGVIVPTINRTFFANMLNGIEETASQHGFGVIICQSNELESKEITLVENLLKLKVDGIIISITKTTKQNQHFAKAMSGGTPVFFIDRIVQGFETTTVSIDDYEGAYRATKHLIDQGCKKIACFCGMPSLFLYRERYRGYKDALLHNNILFDESIIFESLLQQEDGQKLMTKLIQSKKTVDGILSFSDYAALGAILTCKTHDIKIPEEIAICGFSNEPFTSYIDPAITTVEQGAYEQGSICAETIILAIKDKTNYTPRKISLSPQLVIRNSSTKVKP
jgi:LacI family transcriptional regulator